MCSPWSACQEICTQPSQLDCHAYSHIARGNRVSWALSLTPCRVQRAGRHASTPPNFLIISWKLERPPKYTTCFVARLRRTPLAVPKVMISSRANCEFVIDHWPVLLIHAKRKLCHVVLLLQLDTVRTPYRTVRGLTADPSVPSLQLRWSCAWTMEQLPRS